MTFDISGEFAPQEDKPSNALPNGTQPPLPPDVEVNVAAGSVVVVPRLYSPGGPVALQLANGAPAPAPAPTPAASTTPPPTDPPPADPAPAPTDAPSGDFFQNLPPELSGAPLAAPPPPTGGTRPLTDLLKIGCGVAIIAACAAGGLFAW